MKRRQFIQTTALGLGGIALGPALNAPGLISNSFADTQRDDPFKHPFVVPPLETGRREGNKVQFELAMRVGSSNFLGTLETPTLGINADFLGPVIRAKRGDRLSFAVTNHIPDITTLHWHGFVLPAKMDGGPHQVIEPGETWRPEFEIIQPASTCWYHAHTHGKTGLQVYHGLAGMFIIDDEFSLGGDLPIDYGVDDIPVVIQDRSFNRDGSLRYLGSMQDRMMGMQGNMILVNGVVTPTLRAERSLLRLRLLNGSNARIYDLAFHDGRPFTVIAADGGFLEKPVTTQNIRLAPAERAEILVDLSDGRNAILRNQPVAERTRGGMMNMMGMMNRGNQAFNIMKITAPNSAEKTRIQIPETIRPLPDWRDVEPANSRHFQLEMAMGPGMMMSRMFGGSAFSINGKAFDMKRIDARVKSGSFEIWEVGNRSMLPHPFHIHNTQFRVLARSGRNISVTEQALKDTVLVYPMEKVRLLVPFPEYSDPKRPYMFHCHILEHEDGGMMGQFTVEA